MGNRRGKRIDGRAEKDRNKLELGPKKNRMVEWNRKKPNRIGNLMGSLEGKL